MLIDGGHLIQECSVTTTNFQKSTTSFGNGQMHEKSIRSFTQRWYGRDQETERAARCQLRSIFLVKVTVSQRVWGKQALSRLQIFTRTSRYR
jgi:hypothetical protein